MTGCLSEGRRSYISYLREFCLRIYSDLAVGRPIFVDKTPGYYLILDFLAEVFPDSKFIFLFRNPLDVICSMMSTWLDDRLMLHAYHLDLHEGIRRMSRGARNYAERSIGIRYEELVQAPAREVERICSFLGIDYVEEMLTAYKKVDFGGTMGDPVGIHRYDGVSTASVNVWPRQLNNRYRIRFARKYLQSLGDEVLAPWGFSAEQFEREVREMDIRFRGSFKDLGYRQVSDFWRLISGRHLRTAFQRRKTRGVYLYH